MNFADAVYIMLPQYTGPLPSETAEDDLADLHLKRLEVLKERRRLIRERDDLERIIRERDHQLAELDEQIRVAELMTQGARHEP